MADVEDIGSLSQISPTVNLVTLGGMSVKKWGPRIIPDCQMIYLLSGRAWLYLGTNIFELKPGDMAIYGNSNPHKLILQESTPISTYYGVHFNWHGATLAPVHPSPLLQTCNEEDIYASPPRNYVLEYNNNRIAIPHFHANIGLESFFQQLFIEYSKKSEGYEIILRGLVIQLLGTLLRSIVANTDESTADHRRKILPALKAIHDSIDMQLTVQDLARICGYNPTYFSEIFDLAMKCTPKQYIMKERIKRAQGMLLEDYSISEVAQLLGYNSIHYFSRDFKTSTGRSPTDYCIHNHRTR